MKPIIIIRTRKRFKGNKKTQLLPIDIKGDLRTD